MTFAIDCRLTTPIHLHVSFEIRGFTALLGRSGAGKTSLLKALAGLLPATGTPWPGLAPEARPIGYMPQGAALFPHLTVLENAAFALRGRNKFATALNLLNDLGIGHLAARNAAKISDGEAQRVALARALARNPALLLLDEPSAALDAATRDGVMTWLVETIGARNIPALAATHDHAIAALADWLVLLDGGCVIRQGTPRDVFNDPQGTAAARLLGYQNFWQEDGFVRCIRAEDVEIAETGLPASIVIVREQAGDVRLECAAPRSITVRVKGASKADFCAGSMVFLRFPAEKTRKLDPV